MREGLARLASDLEPLRAVIRREVGRGYVRGLRAIPEPDAAILEMIASAAHAA